MTLDEARKAAPDDRPDNRPRMPPYPPTTASVRKDKEPYIPPVPPSTEYVRKRPPEPPKPRCIADEPGYLEKNKRHSEICVLLSFSILFITCLIIVFYPDPRIDPKRTDYAVQAGIRECERTLPRTQTCELSQMSFKVVEKKGW